ncbi:hypothetical protein CCACVL1_03019 [Corchorus capsularis]|uniref:RNase H type-1 domain-containing protein n=1 Tax=Corchorus capsularis TaxID=210143 RepID=A0A1R3K3Q3_COCAP|nr:hypothetical protein CCACVL1_03019 [Corchorus capsularis]
MVQWCKPPSCWFILNTDGSRCHADNHATAKGCALLVVEMDVAVVVHFLRNSMLSSHPCYTLVRDCLEIIEGGWIIEIRHVYREGNRCADCLAMLAHDAANGLSICPEPPDELLTLISICPELAF